MLLSRRADGLCAGFCKSRGPRLSSASRGVRALAATVEVHAVAPGEKVKICSGPPLVSIPCRIVRRVIRSAFFLALPNSARSNLMRFMVIVKATTDSEAGRFPDDSEKLFTAMAQYHEQLAKAGVLLDASGLQPSSKGWRVCYDGERRTVLDGPFTESKELIAGYTLIQVRSRAEALEWSRRFPNPVSEGKPAEIEVRQLYE